MILLLIFVTMAAASVITPLQRDLIKVRLSGTNDALAVFVAAGLFAQFLAGPFAGFIIDRFGHRQSIVRLASGVNAAALCAIAWAPDYTTVLPARFIEGAAGMFIIGPLFAAAAKRHLGRIPVVALAGFVLGLGIATGMAVGGLIGKHDINSALYCAAGSMSIVLLLGGRVGEEAIHKHARNRRWKRLVLFLVAARPRLLAPLTLGFVERLLVGFIITAAPLFVREELFLDPAIVGRTLAFMTGTMAVFSVPGGMLARRFGPAKVAVGGALLYASGIALSGWGGVAWVSVCFAAAGAGAGLMTAPLMMFTLSLAPEKLGNTVMSVFLGLGSLGFLLGPFTAMALYHLYDQSAQKFAWAALTVGGLLAGITLVFCPVILKPKVRGMRKGSL